MDIKQKLLSIILSLILMGFILVLVKKRKLREEYSLLWLITGITIFCFAASEQLIYFIAHLVKAISPVSVIYLLGIMFLMILCLHFSVTISSLKTKLKELTQQIALLEVSHKEATNKKAD